MTTTEFAVTGMTCGNCEKHVREEVEQVAGITGVEVSHRTGRLAVTTAGDVDDAAVLAAVAESGYTAIRA
ncbi:MAG: cation transporter [Actinobacteria bacterium]|nr:cation transporter [Actinomycetota bacterium]